MDYIFKDGGIFTKLFSPKGEVFMLPRGADVNVYIRKGFTKKPITEPIAENIETPLEAKIEQEPIVNEEVPVSIPVQKKRGRKCGTCKKPTQTE